MGMSLSELLDAIKECPYTVNIECFIQNLLHGTEACASKTCYECRKENHSVITETIEQAMSQSKSTGLPEGIEWPRFESGELVKFGDMIGDEIIMGPVDNFDIYKDHAVLWSFAKCGTVRVEFSGKPLKRLEPESPDTQEAIDADIAKDPCEYFGADGETCDECELRKRIGDKILTVRCGDEMKRDLLARQRKLLEGAR